MPLLDALVKDCYEAPFFRGGILRIVHGAQMIILLLETASMMQCFILLSTLYGRLSLTTIEAKAEVALIVCDVY